MMVYSSRGGRRRRIKSWGRAQNDLSSLSQNDPASLCKFNEIIPAGIALEENASFAGKGGIAKVPLTLRTPFVQSDAPSKMTLEGPGEPRSE